MAEGITTQPASVCSVLFPGDDAAEALGRSLQPPTGAVSSLSRSARRAFARDLSELAVGLVDLDLGQALVNGWQKHHELTAAARRTQQAPGQSRDRPPRHPQDRLAPRTHRRRARRRGPDRAQTAHNLPRYRIVASVPEGQLDAERRAGMVAEITKNVLDAEPEGRDRDAFRVWVFANEITEGTWGAAGQIFGLADIAGFVLGDHEAGRAHAKTRLSMARAEREAVFQ